MSDRIPETYSEPRTSEFRATPRNPYSVALLVIWIVGGVNALYWLLAGSGSLGDPEGTYNPEGELYLALGYAWTIVTVAAVLVHLGVKAVLWKAPAP